MLGDLWVGELLVSEDDEAESCETDYANVFDEDKEKVVSYDFSILCYD